MPAAPVRLALCTLLLLAPALTGSVLLLPRAAVDPTRVAAQGALAAAPTESNNQRKVVGSAGRLYAVAARPVAGSPHVVVDWSRDGRTWRTLGRADRAAGAAVLAALTADRRGRVHLAWTQYDGPLGRVYYSRHGGRPGGAWAVPVRLSSPAAYAGYPALEADADGLHLLWYGIREDTTGLAAHGGVYEIFHRRYDGLWRPAQRISVGTLDALNPALAVDARGRAHAVWFQSDGRAYQVVYAQWTRNRWSRPAYLTSGTRPSVHPALAADGGGRLHLVWERDGAVLYAVRAPEGQWSDPMRVAGSGTHPTVGLWSRGVIVLWEDRRGVWLRAFDGRWHRPRRLGGGAYPHAFPSRPGEPGRPVALWSVGDGVRLLDLTPLLP